VRNTELDSVVGGIQHLLSAVVRLPAVASLDGALCNEQLEVATKEYRKEIILIAADVKGAVLCSSLPRHLGVVVTDHAIFHEVMGSGQFRVGKYELNPITGAKAISFGYPIGSDAGGPTGVMIAYLALDWLGS